MYKRVNSFLLDNHILYDFQFGFRKNHSTSLALMEVLDYIYHSLDAKEYVAGSGGASYRAKGLKLPPPQFLLQPLQNSCVK